MVLCTNAGFWQNDVAQAHPPQTHLSSQIYEVKYFYSADRAGSYPTRGSPIHLHRLSRRGAGRPSRTRGCFLRGVCAVMGWCAHRRGLSALGFAAPTPRGPAPRGWVCTDSESAAPGGESSAVAGRGPPPTPAGFAMLIPPAPATLRLRLGGGGAGDRRLGCPAREGGGGGGGGGGEPSP